MAEEIEAALHDAVGGGCPVGTVKSRLIARGVLRLKLRGVRSRAVRAE
jgi:hypothetical protein